MNYNHNHAYHSYTDYPKYIYQDGGACSICGAEGVTKTTCPQNPSAKNPKPEKHKRSVIERDIKEKKPKTVKPKVTQTKPLVEKKPVVETKPLVEKKPVVKTKPIVEKKPVVESITAAIETPSEVINRRFHFKTTLFKLKGPSDVVYFRNMKLKGEKGPGRNILLLGEYHDFTPGCDSKDNLECFSNWIDYVSKNSPYCFDFFLEGTTTHAGLRWIKPNKKIVYKGGSDLGDVQGRGDLSNNPNIIMDIRELFTPRNMKKLKNTRFHSIDLRLIDVIKRMDVLGQTRVARQILFNYEADYTDGNDDLSRARKSIESYIEDIHFGNKFKREVISQIKSVGTLNVFIDLLVKVMDRCDFTELYKYDIIKDLILPDNARLLDDTKYTIQTILKNKSEQKLLNKYIENLKDSSSRYIIGTFHEHLENASLKIKEMNEHILNTKYIIERQLSKSLLTKADFIKNADIWFAGREKYKNILHFTAQMFLMDVYSLSRMFATFDESKLNRGPVKCRDALYRIPRNIVFYGGSLHTESYRKLLDRLDITKSRDNFIRSENPIKKSISFNKIYKNGFDFFENAI